MISKRHVALRSKQCLVNPSKNVGSQKSALTSITDAFLLHLDNIRILVHTKRFQKKKPNFCYKDFIAHVTAF